jgi:hypothetical protein
LDCDVSTGRPLAAMALAAIVSHPSQDKPTLRVPQSLPVLALIISTSAIAEENVSIER